MKKEQLQEILKNGVNDENKAEVISSILSINGNDINNAKKTAIDTYDLSGFIASEKHQEALNKIKELSAKLDGMKDYDDMKKNYEKLTAEAEKGRRTDFIKSLGFNSHPELLVGSFDFSNLKYNETSKTYEGDKLEEITKAFKESYKDMLDEHSNNPKPSYSHSFAPQPSGGGNNDLGYDEVLTKL